MKHPVDTNAWGEFVVGELFDCDTTKTFYPNKSELPEGNTPYITRSTYDNGVSGYYNDMNNEFTIEGNCLTIGAEGGVAFWQPKPFIAGVKVYTIRHPRLNELTALFIAGILNTNSANYSYTNARVLAKIQAEPIKLPLKPSADPSNYDQTDIDWDYMDTVMSRVTEKAKDRLANLPQPSEKQKTPVDTSSWGEFNIINLFDIINTKSIRQSDVQEQLQSSGGSTPYITASDKNNAIVAYIECPQEWIDKGNCIFIGGKTTTVTYQPQDFCSNDSHNLALYLKNEQARTKYIQLYLTAILKKAFAKYHWGNALSKTKIQAESIKLPLKPSADPTNYTQDDIDWDVMDRFMQAIKEKAHERLVELNSYKNEDD